MFDEHKIEVRLRDGRGQQGWIKRSDEPVAADATTRKPEPSAHGTALFISQSKSSFCVV